ncbi:MAG: peptidyl-prolyl cis-trans isomerase [Planctomycetota bacterium]
MLSLSFLVLTALAAAALRQAAPIDGILATVDGAAITRNDVTRAMKEHSSSLTSTEVLQQLVLRKILDRKAREANLVVPDSRLSEVLEGRVAQAGSWEEYTKRLEELGKTVEEDRKEVRDALLVDEYVSQCLGRVPGSPLLRPRLARSVRVTPAEVQAYFRENRERFRTADRKEVGRLLVVKAHFDSDEEARDHAELLRQQSLKFHEGRLGQVILEGDRASYGTMTLSGPDQPRLLEEIRAFLEAAPVKVLSPVIETRTAYVVVVKLSEERGHQLEFDQVQEGVFSLLSELKYRAARQELGHELLLEVDLWPKNLFGSETNAGTGVAPQKEPP